MREKTFKNTPKGRSEIPARAGEYMFLDNRGNNINRNIGWGWANNLRRRIMEEHYDKSKTFSYIKIRYGKIKKKKRWKSKNE